MTTANREFERRLEEVYKNIKPYLYDDNGKFDKEENPTLYDMCKKCKKFCGDEHNFEECRNETCFKCWLAYEYLNLKTELDVYGI